jgi:hypothetical protein
VIVHCNKHKLDIPCKSECGQTHKRDWRGATSFVKSANFAENCPFFATIGTFCSIIHESFSIFDPVSVVQTQPIKDFLVLMIFPLQTEVH